MNSVENNNNNLAHPCQYCKTPCFGKQCKNCHLKMMENRKGNCIDCKNEFNALRTDGTKRKRCFTCQEKFNETFVRICKDCNSQYRYMLNDGRKFNICFTCYQKKLKKCDKCDNMTFEKLPLCKICYNNDKKNFIKETEDQSSSSSTSSEDIVITKKCQTIDCDTLTSYTFCKNCHTKHKNISNEFQ
jgi:hypothetical protein